jgi:hypothetical protein
MFKRLSDLYWRLDFELNQALVQVYDRSMQAISADSRS